MMNILAQGETGAVGDGQERRKQNNKDEIEASSQMNWRGYKEGVHGQYTGPSVNELW